MRKGAEISLRLMKLSVEATKAIEGFPQRRWTAHVSSQLLRAITAGAANYEEARHSESRADFIHKLGLAGKEVAEARYWMTFAAELGASVSPASIAEASELIAILVASSQTARRNAAASAK